MKRVGFFILSSTLFIGVIACQTTPKEEEVSETRKVQKETEVEVNKTIPSKSEATKEKESQAEPRSHSESINTSSSSSSEDFVYLRIGGISPNGNPIFNPGDYHRSNCPALAKWKTPMAKVPKRGLPPDFYPCDICNP